MTGRRMEGDSVDERIVRSLQRLGPRSMPRISRMTGVHTETVRYKVNRHFRGLGLRIRLEVDYRRLGLVPFWAELGFSGSPEDVLLALGRCAYLASCSRLLPKGTFACLFTLPDGAKRKHEELLAQMKRARILDGFAIDEVTAYGSRGMDPRFFDFRKGGWEIDWNKVRRGRGPDVEPEAKVYPERLDLEDVLLIRELQADPLQHLVSVARKLKVDYKALLWHWAHVKKRELISGYPMSWEPQADGAVLTTNLTFRDLGGELPRVRQAVGRIPFLRSEYVCKDGTYVAFLDTPVRETEGLLGYLDSEAPKLQRRAEISYVRRGESKSFTLPYEMFRGWEWTYDLKEAVAAVRAGWRASKRSLD